MAERSIHDNIVYSYFVDCSRRQVKLHTSYNEKDACEYTDVLFSGVVAHLFENVLSGNILFGIYNVEPSDLVNANANLFKESWRYGWPLEGFDYRGDLELLTQHLTQMSVRGFDISSSYGMSGWVLAERCEIIAREAAFVLGNA
jgi:hypothetical protein